MGVLVKTVHSAMAEGKEPKAELEKRRMQYRNTPHPHSEKAPNQLMLGRKVRTGLLAWIKPMDSLELKQVRESDKQVRLAKKEMGDKVTAQETKVKEEDRLLESQRKSTNKPLYNWSTYQG